MDNAARLATNMNHAKSLFIMRTLGVESAFDRPKEPNRFRTDLLGAYIGALSALSESIHKGAIASNVDPVTMFNELVRENENGFATSFGSISEQEIGEGRLALKNLADYLNAQNNGGSFEASTEDPELIQKLSGCLNILSKSFLKEIQQNGLTDSKLEILRSIYSNTVDAEYVMFTEEMKNIGDSSKEELEMDDYIYAQFEANVQVLNMAFSIVNTFIDGPQPNEFQVNSDMDLFAETLGFVTDVYREEIERRGVDFEDVVEDYIRTHKNSEEFVIDTRELSDGLMWFKEQDATGVFDGDRVNALATLASFSLLHLASMDAPGNVSLEKVAETRDRKTGDALLKEVMIRSMRTNVDWIGSAEDDYWVPSEDKDDE